MNKIPSYSFILVVILFIGINHYGFSQTFRNKQNVEVVMRMIGHKTLLDSGDSTSRVLPIIKNDGVYKIEFDTSLQIDPTNLVATVSNLISKSELSASYVVEVLSCDSEKVVYSYQIGRIDSTDMVPCGGRILPKGCYIVSISFLDNLLPFANANSAMAYKSEEPQKTYFGLILFFAISLGLALLWYIFRRTNEEIESDPNIIKIGNYHLDKRNMVLSYENINIELTSKEADLLLLLHSSANVTVKRELILEKVWGDEGDYIGRTLDVFISKLRKKLQADENIKIANIRGIGYRLILND